MATVGCRRCGGGLAGAVSTSNVAEGARVAADLDPDLVVFDGSGAALPPIAADRTVVVVGGHQDPAVAAGYLNTYRLLLADLVVVTMAESGSAWELVRERVAAVARPGVPVVATTLRPRPLVDRARPNRRVLLRCASGCARTPPTSISRTFTAHASSTSPAISRTERRSTTSCQAISADVYLVELKAAAIDVVAEAALAKGADVVLAANDVVSIAGEPDLDELLLDMAKFQT